MPEAMASASNDPRLVAALAVADVLAGCSLSDALPARSQRLEGRDRAFAAEMAYGTCRWFWRLDGLVANLLARPLKRRHADLRALLLCGAYQLLYMRVPAHAAVAETVTAARLAGKAWASGLVNGVLRRLQREQSEQLSRLDAEPVTRYALPGWLIANLSTDWPSRWQAVCEALNERPVLTLRVNRTRISVEDYAARLAALGVEARPVSGLRYAFTLDAPRDVTEIPGFEQGLVSVQDAGAQRAGGLLDLAAGQRVLDACAAPGGKTGQLLELQPQLAVTALDMDSARLARVADNLKRLGLEAKLLVADASAPEGWWDGATFDRVLLDVPCSATGVIRRHPDIRMLRRASDVGALVARQDAILEAVWPLLRPGGKLLYATCSLLSAENEDRIAAFLPRHPDAVALPLHVDWGHRRGSGRQLLPGEYGGDGFYYALLQKEMT